jgi:hypothetical protein
MPCGSARIRTSSSCITTCRLFPLGQDIRLTRWNGACYKVLQARLGNGAWFSIKRQRTKASVILQRMADAFRVFGQETARVAGDPQGMDKGVLLSTGRGASFCFEPWNVAQGKRSVP